MSSFESRLLNAAFLRFDEVVWAELVCWTLRSCFVSSLAGISNLKIREAEFASD